MDIEDCCIRCVKFSSQDPAVTLTRLREIGIHYGCEIVVFNSNLMAGMDHARAALKHAIRAWSEGSSIARTLPVEALLFAAGTRQSAKARAFGVHEGENRAFCAFCPGSDAALGECLTFMELSEGDFEDIDDKKRELLITHFGITRDEIRVTGIDRLKDLVLERVALLWVYR